MNEDIHWNPINELHKFDNIYYETRDNQGRLHSFDDKPAFIAGSKVSNKQYLKIDLSIRDNRPELNMRAIYARHDVEYNDETGRLVIIYKKTKDNKCKIWYKHGKIHRDEDKPAVLMTAGPEILSAYVWYYNGIITRNNDKPALIAKVRPNYLYGDESKLRISKWYTNGLVHRNELPAIVILYDNKNLYTTIWMNRGKLRMDDSPSKRQCSLIEYNQFNEVEQYIYGKHSEELHNAEAYHNGNIHHIWIETPELELIPGSTILLNVRFKYHRLTGPAIVVKDSENRIVCERLWIHGKYQDEE